MAETKSKKNNSKVFDVAKPGKSAPTATSKPVIITHRPVLQDPMVVNIEVTDDAKPLASPSEVRRKVQIVPLHDADGNDVAPGAPVVDKVKVTKKDDASEGALVLDLPPEVTGEKAKVSETTSAPELPNEATESNEAPKAVEAARAEKPKESKPKETVPSAEPESEKEAETDPTEPAEKTTDEPQGTPNTEPLTTTETEATTEPSAPIEDDDTSDFGLLPDPVEGDEGQVNPDAAKQKADEEAKKIAEEQQKIIDSGAYYLPIDAVAHRKAVHHTIIGIILVLLFGTLLFLAALDAEMFTINGFPAPTDYL